MGEQERTWTSEEALANLESLTRLEWDKEKLPGGVQELLGTYETAIPQLAAEILRLRSKLREQQGGQSGEDNPGAGNSGTTDAHEDLTEFARRLGLEQR